MKQILGVVGEKRAGKGTFCEIFCKFAEIGSLALEVSVHRYSDIIGECLDLLELPRSRENMQKFSPLIESGYGKGVFSRAMTTRVAMSPANVVIIEGIRWMTDLAELRRYGGTLVYVTANKDVRFARSFGNSEKPDEANISREKFEEQENAQTEVDIPRIGSYADVRLENNGTMEEFEVRVAHFAAEYLPGWKPK